jgi:hypothetical protein
VNDFANDERVNRALDALARECEFCHGMHSILKIAGNEASIRCGPGLCGVWDAKAALRMSPKAAGALDFSGSSSDQSEAEGR